MFTCGNSAYGEHQHATTYEARVCYGFIARTESAARVETRRHIFNRATDKQLGFLERLGYRGDTSRLTVAEASAIIDNLKKTQGVRMSENKPDPLVEAVKSMLPFAQTGYYAVRADDTEPYVFLRITDVKTGRLKGMRKVQTQHSGSLIDRFAMSPTGNFYMLHTNRKSALEGVMFAVAEPDKAGLAYARELGRCCRCNADLTDERSRHYGIGPECEKHRPTVIEAVDLMNDGRSYEALQAVR